MTLPQLSASDLSRFNDQVAEFYARGMAGNPMAAVAATLESLIGGSVAAASLGNLPPAPAQGTSPALLDFALSREQKFDWSPEQLALFQTHPRLVNGPKGEVLSVSDFLSVNRWHRMDLYQVQRGGLEMEDDLGVDLVLPHGRLFQGCVIRETRGFSEKERLLFHLLIPHIRTLLSAPKNQLPGNDQAPSAADLAGLGLTRREQDVLFWVTEGKANADVAAILQISPGTVRVHLEHIYAKLGVENRMAASRVALEKLHPGRFS